MLERKQKKTTWIHKLVDHKLNKESQKTGHKNYKLTRFFFHTQYTLWFIWEKKRILTCIETQYCTIYAQMDNSIESSYVHISIRKNDIKIIFRIGQPKIFMKTVHYKL